MPTFLSDPAPAFYLILVVLCVVIGGIWYRYRDRGSMIRALIAVAMLILLFLCDRLFESPREESIRKVLEMTAAASEPPNPDKFVENISDSFESFNANKEKVRKSGAWDLVRTQHAKIDAWDFTRDKFKEISDTEIELEFMAKATAKDGGFLMRYVRARFVRDPDGKYRLKSVKFYNPADGGMNREEPIPGFP